MKPSQIPFTPQVPPIGELAVMRWPDGRIDFGAVQLAQSSSSSSSSSASSSSAPKPGIPMFRVNNGGLITIQKEAKFYLLGQEDAGLRNENSWMVSQLIALANTLRLPPDKTLKNLVEWAETLQQGIKP